MHVNLNFISIHNLAVTPSEPLYKQPQFTVSSVVPVEFWKSAILPSSSGCYSIEVSLFRFSILLLFLSIVDF